MKPPFDNNPRRSRLFVPALAGHRIDGALRSAADVVVVDLEDSIAPDQKDAARAELPRILSKPRNGKELVIRINHPSTDAGKRDLEALEKLEEQTFSICIPKLEYLQDVTAVSDVFPKKDLWGIFETAKGMYNIRDIINQKTPSNLRHLSFGQNDFAMDMGIETTDHIGLQLARTTLIMAARARGMSVHDGPSQNLLKDPSDIPAFREECEQARRYGFDGKSAIHPNQLEHINAGFSPSQQEIEEARGTVAAFSAAREEGKGVAVYKGKMVEHLHATGAQKTLDYADTIAELGRKRGGG